MYDRKAPFVYARGPSAVNWILLNSGVAGEMEWRSVLQEEEASPQRPTIVTLIDPTKSFSEISAVGLTREAGSNAIEAAKLSTG
jgi:hypothetical protein